MRNNRLLLMKFINGRHSSDHWLIRYRQLCLHNRLCCLKRYSILSSPVFSHT